MFQDIKVTSKRSLREVLPKKAGDRETALKPERVHSAPRPRRPRRWRRWGFGFLLIILLGLAYLVSQILASVLITVQTQQTEIAFNGDNVILHYETVEPEALSESQTVKLIPGTVKEKKATGRVVIYNNYSNKPQALVINTRLETADGKIYRLNQPVTVPGGKEIDGKFQPGTVAVGVTADKTGVAFNLSDFSATKLTIPGFKNDPRYAKFYALPQSGFNDGASGAQYVLDPAEKSKILNQLKQTLTEKITRQINFQLPENYFLPDNFLELTFSEDLQSSPANPQEGSLLLVVRTKAYIFEKKSLTQSLLADRLPAEFKDYPLTISNLSALELIANFPAANREKKQIPVAVNGKAKVTLILDTAALQSRLAGLKRLEMENIFKEFPAIAEAQVDFHPFWVQRFPREAERIIINTLP